MLCLFFSFPVPVWAEEDAGQSPVSEAAGSEGGSSDDGSSSDDGGSSDDGSSADDGGAPVETEPSGGDDAPADDGGSTPGSDETSGGDETNSENNESGADTGISETVTTEAAVPAEETEETEETETELLSTSTEGVLTRSPGSTTVRRYVKARGMQQVEADRMYALQDILIYEETSADARAVGRLVQDGVCYVLEKTDSDWYYVESGEVRGFAEADLLRKSVPQQLIEQEKSVFSGTGPEALEGTCVSGGSIYWMGNALPARHAEALVDRTENKALLHTMTTTQKIQTERKPAQATEDLSFYVSLPEKKDGEPGTSVGTLAKDGICYILETISDQWVFAESGQVRGYVKQELLNKKLSEETDELVLARPADETDTAEGYRGSFRSVYYSVPEGFLETSVEELLTSDLADGAVISDDNAFPGQVLGAYGCYIGMDIGDYLKAGEHTNAPQIGDIVIFSTEEPSAETEAEEETEAESGKGEKNENLLAGLYAGDGHIVYMENGRACRTETSEAVISDIRSVLTRTQEIPASTNIHEANAPEENYGKYLGTFKLTYYCPCAQCCDVATGLTSTGVVAAQGETIAVDPAVIPYGTRVIVNGHIFIAQDCGGAIKGKRIDVFVSTHDMTNQSVEYGEVYLLNN